MCLSAVYVRRPQGEEELLCRNVANVSIQQDKLTFIDIMGIRTEYEGKLRNMDLMENKILVESVAR